jgi:hypothetical protein
MLGRNTFPYVIHICRGAAALPNCRVFCQLSLYLRIERFSITLRANGATTLFANEGWKLVIIEHWATPFTGSTPFLMTIFSGESNGSAGLVTTRTFRATPKSAFAWRSFPRAKGIHSAPDPVPFRRKGRVK